MSQHEAFFADWRGAAINILAVGDPAVDVYLPDQPITRMWQDATGMAIEIDVVPWPEYATKVFEVLGASDPATDVVMLPGFFWLPSFAASGWLAPLEPLAAGLADAWQAYDNKAIMPALREELSFEGTRYLIPSFAEVQMVFYRRDWVEEVGLGPLSTPLPVERFMEIARALHDPPRRYGTHLKGSPAESLPEWLPYLSELGGELFDAQERPLFGGEAGRRSLQLILDLKAVCGPGIEESDNEAVLELIHTGKLGIVNHWSGQAAQAVSLEHNPEGDRYGFSTFANPWGTVWAFGVHAASQNKAAALAYLLWATNKENDRLQGLRSGSPVRRTSFSDAAGQSACPWYPTLLEALARKRSFPSFVRFADCVGALYGMVNQVLAGSADIEAALQTAVEQTSPLAQ